MSMTKIIEVTPNNLEDCFAFWDFKDDKEKKSRIVDELKNKRRKMFACVIGNEYVAGFSISVKNSLVLHFSYLTVKGEYRGNGIGSLCIDYAIQIAKQQKLKGVSLKVDMDNDGAKRLYERKGFILQEKRKERMIMFLKC